MTQKIIEIDKYLHSSSRNKIVFYRDELTNITPTNIGEELAKKIKPHAINEKISLISKPLLADIFSSNILFHKHFGNILAISNIGILFEPALKINFQSLISNLSSNTSLFVKWDGDIDNNKLFFLSKQHGIKLNLNNISHIII